MPLALCDNWEGKGEEGGGRDRKEGTGITVASSY